MSDIMDQSGQGSSSDFSNPEKLHRVLFEESPDSLYIADQQGRLMAVNACAIELTGYPRGDLLGMNIANLISPENLARDPIPFEELALGKYVIKEYLLLRKDGSLVPVETHARMLSGGHILGITFDITERKRAEETIRWAEQRYRGLFEEAPMMYVITRNQQDVPVITDCNRSFLDTLGYARDEVIGRLLADFYTPRSRAALLKSGYRRALEGFFGDEERQLLARDGRVVETLLRALPETDIDGNVIGTRAMYTDITKRKMAEAERERLMTAIEQAGEAVLIADTDSCIRYVNPAFARITGYAAEEVIGENPRILKSGEHDRVFYENLWATITSGKTWQGSIVNKRKDGTLYNEAATISPVRDEAGTIVSYVAVKRDITEHLRLEAQLRQAQKMESVGRLAGGVAHDINNMLSIIFSYAELAKSQVHPDNPLHKHLQEIFNAAQRSADITRQLLAFARRQTVTPRVLDLNETVERMLKMLRRLIGEDIDLAWLPETSLYPVKMDPSQVDQILANLCLNARDSIAGVGKITIESAKTTFDEAYCAGHAGFVSGDFVLLAVSDNGYGMDKETLGNIFEPFFTTKDVGKGTGLGLATVYGIVKQNNGFINVYSEPGQGTTFKIYFPRHSGETAQVQQESPVQIPLGSGETVLIVEDEAAILEVTTKMLEAIGYKVLAAAKPSEALRLAGACASGIHLLITDVVMPEMNGRDLAGHLMALNSEMKVLFMSGYTADAIARCGVLDDGVQFLQKPFSMQDLAVKVRRALGRE